VPVWTDARTHTKMYMSSLAKKQLACFQKKIPTLLFFLIPSAKLKEKILQYFSITPDLLKDVS